MRQQIDDRASLADLDGVRVVVDDPIPRDLSRELMTEAIKSQLREAGIRVLGLGDFPTGDPHMRITVSASTSSSNLAGLFVQVDFVQIVFLRRNPQVTFNRAQTWKAQTQVLLVPSAQLARTVSTEITRQVEQFVAAYRVANA